MKKSVRWKVAVWLRGLHDVGPNIAYILKTYDFKRAIPNIRAYGLRTFLENARREIFDEERLQKPVSPILQEMGGCGNVYFNYLFGMNNTRDKEYVPLSVPNIPETNIKLIAFYLPQFHPIPENDEWWGKGFTEWTNVTKAVPQFIGHYQPRLPGELGFYDLRVPEVQRRQVELAKQYGIHGFCFHFYWFNGKRLLEEPLEQFLADPEIDFPFCINWANESWSRRWDGKEGDILLQQRHSADDDMAFIAYISKYLKDPRYIRIDGKPLVSVYRPGLFPNALATSQRWRDHCRNDGIGDIYLALSHAFEHTNPRSIGFDAAIEFAPNTFPLREMNDRFQIVNDNYQGEIFDYEQAVVLAEKYRKPAYKKFRCICPSWDNEARKPGRGYVLANSHPDAYKKWLRLLCDFTRENLDEKERLIFINAWNEWAESAYLEPDRRFGYAYLGATAEVLQGLSNKPIESKQLVFYGNVHSVVRRHDTAVIFHLYYPDMWDEIREYLANLNGEFDLFVSIPHDVNFSPKIILEKYKDAYIYECKNRGRDIAPFLALFGAIYPADYKYALKIHTKRSQHRQDGDVWRRDLLDKLAGSPDLIGRIKEMFDARADVGIVAPQGHVVPSSFYWGANEKTVQRLAGMFGISFEGETFDFVGGSMFWFRPAAFKAFVDHPIEEDAFEVERGQVDGTLAHGVERFLGLLMARSGYKIVEFGVSEKGQAENSDVPAYRFADATDNEGRKRRIGKTPK
jgi:lipopolysaccharide biosynthesis protein